METMKKKLMMLVLSLVLCVTTVGQFSTPVQAEERTDYVIKVNKGTNCVTVYDKDGKPVKAMICSPSNETPVGTFYTPVKYKWHEMIGNCYAQYCTRITWDGILFHSVWYYKKGDKSTMSVSAYNVMGNKASHGCVRLLCKDAKWIYDNCALKTKVVIFNGTKKDDPLGRPSFTPLSTKSRTSWDPTDPDPKNPFRGNKPTITAKATTVELGSKTNVKDLVLIKDSAGNELTAKEAKVKVKGKVNTAKVGTYKVTYRITDKLGKKTSKTLKFKVVDTQRPVIKVDKKKKTVAMTTTQNLLNGVTAQSVSGKDLTQKIKVTVTDEAGNKVRVKQGNVTFDKAGTYKVVYKVTGNNKKTRTATVKYNVVDRGVKLTVNTNITINQGETFEPLKYVSELKTFKGVAIDIAKNVSVTGTVNSNVPGTYKVVYAAANRGIAYTRREVEVTVTVVAKTPETTTVPQTTTKVPEATTTPETTTKAPEATTTPETTKQEETTAPQTTKNSANQDKDWSERY